MTLILILSAIILFLLIVAAISDYFGDYSKVATDKHIPKKYKPYMAYLYAGGTIKDSVLFQYSSDIWKHRLHVIDGKVDVARGIPAYSGAYTLRSWETDFMHLNKPLEDTFKFVAMGLYLFVTCYPIFEWKLPLVVTFILFVFINLIGIYLFRFINGTIFSWLEMEVTGQYGSSDYSLLYNILFSLFAHIGISRWRKRQLTHNKAAFMLIMGTTATKPLPTIFDTKNFKYIAILIPISLSLFAFSVFALNNLDTNSSLVYWCMIFCLVQILPVLSFSVLLYQNGMKQLNKNK